MRWFKRKNKPVCFHEWRVSDMTSFVTPALDIDEIFTIGCAKCGKSRDIDGYEYERMRDYGLISEVSE